MIPYFLTIEEAAAPQFTLAFMFWEEGLFVFPLMLFYTAISGTPCAEIICVLIEMKSQSTVVQICPGVSTYLNLPSKFVPKIRKCIVLIWRLKLRTGGSTIQSIVQAQGN
jgi:hypothetical protein